MHELSVTQGILDCALREAARVHASRIRVIRLRLGPFSGVVPDCIQTYLDLMAEGTAAEGARIEAETVPLLVTCRDCGRESAITRRSIACPHCGGLRLTRRTGNECMIYSLEVDMDGNQDSSSNHGVESGRQRPGSGNAARP